MSRVPIIEVRQSHDRLDLSLEHAIAQHLGLRLRMDEAWRNMRKQIRKIVPSARIEIDGAVCTVYCDAGRASALITAVEDIDRMLLNIADRRLTPRLVRLALGITAQERLRWTKDGRLPRAGMTTFRTSQKIKIDTYAVEEIEKLAADQSVMKSWRAADAAISPAVERSGWNQRKFLPAKDSS
jgi:hypothetical protein